MTKFVSSTCACGTKFDREVKRGRPQVWCPSCALVPFYERTANAVPSVAAIVEAVGTPERISNENDALDSVRPEIESRMALINLEAKEASKAAIEAFGVYSNEHLAVSAANLKAIQNLYAELAPSKYKPGREFSEDVA